MSVFIIGEYSGFAKSLSHGFRENRVEASVYSPNGDGWKNIDADILGSSITSIINVYRKIFVADCIFLMNPDFLTVHKGSIIFPLLLCKLFKKKIVLLCCGDDYYYVSSGEKKEISRYIYENLNNSRAEKYKKLKSKILCYLAGTLASDIVPTMYDYQVGWSKSLFKSKLRTVIPLCSDVEPAKKRNNISKKRIKILHGINREDVKGSLNIKKALERIAIEFTNVEIYLPEKMEYKEYIKLLHSVDFSIDQSRCHSYGMNAIHSLFLGHVVFAPADTYCLESFGVYESPIVSIYDDENDIYEKIKRIIMLEDDKVMELKQRSVSYAIEMHTPKKIAGKFLQMLREQ